MFRRHIFWHLAFFCSRRTSSKLKKESVIFEILHADKEGHEIKINNGQQTTLVVDSRNIQNVAAELIIFTAGSPS